MVVPGDATTSGSDTAGEAYYGDIIAHVDVEDTADVKNVMNHTLYRQHSSYSCDYPTDERTAPSCSPKTKENKRLSILQLARNRLTKKKKVPPNVGKAPVQAADESSFLANADVVDVDDRPTEDGASFLDLVAVEDAATNELSKCDDDTLGNGTNSNSCYNAYASTLSMANSTSTKVSTIGDEIMKDSNKAANMTKNGTYNAHSDNQSASTYSYRRAYIDNATLGSNFTSTCSALTDEYCYDARRTGMSEAIKANDAQMEDDVGNVSQAPCVKRHVSFRVDVDTGSVIQPSSDKSQEESVPRPPPSHLPNHTAAYESPDHLTRIVSFGEGEGYVDEEAARHFEEKNDFCCGWFKRSSLIMKALVIVSVLLMLTSIASVAFAVSNRKEERVATEETSARSSTMPDEAAETVRGNGNDAIEETPIPPTTTPTFWPSYFPTIANDTDTSDRLPLGSINSPTEASTSSGVPSEPTIYAKSSVTTTSAPVSKLPTATPSLRPTDEV